MKAAGERVRRFDQDAYLAALRREFPEFGIVVDPDRPLWMAVRGNDVFIRATDGPFLRERLLELARR